MAKRKRRAEPSSFLDAYRRIRKPMPPPERVISDKRDRLLEDEARREIEEVDEEEPSRDPSPEP